MLRHNKNFFYKILIVFVFLILLVVISWFVADKEPIQEEETTIQDVLNKLTPQNIDFSSEERETIESTKKGLSLEPGRGALEQEENNSADLLKKLTP